MTPSEPQNAAAERLRDRLVGSSWGWGNIQASLIDLDEALAIEREAQGIPPSDARLRAARFVLDHWLTSYLASLKEDSVWGIGTHPLALVQDAMDGETDPAQLGLPGDLHEAFRQHLATPSGGIPLIDVELLARAIQSLKGAHYRLKAAKKHDDVAWIPYLPPAEVIAAEYIRLSESSPAEEGAE